MTFSIAAHDAETGAFGVAVTTKFFGVGSLCPFVEAGVGAVATQAFVNPTFGPRGLRLLAEGRSPQEVVDTLLAGDDGREHRQLHIVDRQGRVAVWIRVDDHPDPVVELRRLFEESKREYLPFKQFLPTRSRPAGIYDRSLIDRIIKEQAEHDQARKNGS